MDISRKEFTFLAVPIAIFIILLLVTYNITSRRIDAQPKIVTIDLKGILEEFVVKSAASKLEGAALEKHVKDYTEKLERLTSQLAEQENFIIIPKNAVLAGGRDISPQVRALIEEGYGDDKTN